MNIDEIISSLEYNHGKIARAALLKAIDEKEAIVPRLLQVIEDVPSRIHKIHDEEAYMLHIYALYLLAQFRETDAYLPIVKLFSFPGDLPVHITGDIVTEDLGRILASTFNGDLEPLKILIEDESLNEYVRSAGLNALCVLWGCGAISRQDIVDYFKYLFTDALVGQTAYMWSSTIRSSLDISPNEMVEEIEKAFEDDLVELFFFNRDDFNSSLGLSNDEALKRFKKIKRHRLIEDTISEMEHWACFYAERRTKNPGNMISRASEKKVGRNDPCLCGSGKKYKKCCLADS